MFNLEWSSIVEFTNSFELWLQLDFDHSLKPSSMNVEITVCLHPRQLGPVVQKRVKS